ncbi:FHA domain-containing protein [Paraliomyxa miuraensis]|uniref:FHA domain-containing protein n=1 Tax=Paraliomyxa miuraensis TaxID=376150 RepID=UPI00224C7D66|nr:FHA domain-containing protein [Paraliomyxa miuraensis]MCX4240609.1 FHA domain-containing protein [Paraliomyxa miuraensis]
MTTRPLTATHDELQAPRWQLRVLSGPLRGAVHQLGDRLSIGRSGSNDLQLAHEVISRQHVHVADDGQGRHVVIDLVSRNGTFVDGRRVERQVLRPHAVIRIADIELIYEPANPRATITWIRWGRDRHPIRFVAPDGTEHGPRLLDEIIEYRTLRAQSRRGELPNPRQQARHDALLAHLRQPAGVGADERRTFCRFECRFPAHLRLASGYERDCQIDDLGVDGARITVAGLDLGPDQSSADGLGFDEFVWLSIPLEGNGHPRDEILTSRIAWAAGSTVGLAFAGAPRSERHRAAAGSPEAFREDAPTMKLESRPAAATLRFERLLAQGLTRGPSRDGSGDAS